MSGLSLPGMFFENKVPKAEGALRSNFYNWARTHQDM
jgi:hypothetical protein